MRSPSTAAKKDVPVEEQDFSGELPRIAADGAAGGAQDVQDAARLPRRARGGRAERRQPGRDQLRRERPDVRLRDARLLRAGQGTPRHDPHARRRRRRRHVREGHRLRRRPLLADGAHLLRRRRVRRGGAGRLLAQGHRRRRQGRRAQGRLHRVRPVQRPGADQQLPAGASTTASTAPPARSGGKVRRPEEPGVEGVEPLRPRLLVRPAHAGNPPRERRRPARHELRRLGPQVRLGQQRPHPDGHDRRPLPRGATRTSASPAPARASPPTGRRRRCSASAPSSRGGSSARGCARAAR